MVKGLDIFYEYFSEYSDQYVLIMEYPPELNKKFLILLSWGFDKPLCNNILVDML